MDANGIELIVLQQEPWRDSDDLMVLIAWIYHSVDPWYKSKHGSTLIIVSFEVIKPTIWSFEVVYIVECRGWSYQQVWTPLCNIVRSWSPWHFSLVLVLIFVIPIVCKYNVQCYVYVLKTKTTSKIKPLNMTDGGLISEVSL